MKTADCPEVIAAYRQLLLLCAYGEIKPSSFTTVLPAYPDAEGKLRVVADVIVGLRHAIEEAQLDNGTHEVRMDCWSCGANDLPRVWCLDVRGVTLRCSDCACHKGHHPIPLWGDYCGGAK